MKAYRCDICNRFFCRIFSPNEHIIKQIDCNPLDLCEKCQEKLENFIKNGEFK